MTAYDASPKPVVGPARCPDCGLPIWFAKRMSRHKGQNTVKARWRDADGRIHRCEGRAR